MDFVNQGTDLGIDATGSRSKDGLDRARLAVQVMQRFMPYLADVQSHEFEGSIYVPHVVDTSRISLDTTLTKEYAA